MEVICEMAKVGDKAPDFTLMSTTGQEITLSEFNNGKNLIIYFYPKNHTQGCTLEAKDFARCYEDLKKKGFEVLGISKDTHKSHCNFRDKNDIPFILLSDKDREVHVLYDVLKLKKVYGREVMSTVRSSFIIDKDGTIIREYRNVRSKGHVDNIMKDIEELDKVEA